MQTFLARPFAPLLALVLPPRWSDSLLPRDSDGVLFTACWKHLEGGVGEAVRTIQAFWNSFLDFLFFIFLAAEIGLLRIFF